MSMIGSITAIPRPVLLRQILWRNPGWWTFALCIGAWWLMVRHALSCGGHEHHHARLIATDAAAHWLLMVLAMMVPLLQDNLRDVAVASLWSRRHRGMLAFLAGYLVVWVAAGIGPVLTRDSWLAQNPFAPTIAFLTAAVWQATPLHQRGLVGCHRAPMLAFSGLKADRDCIWFGMRIGWSCVLSCWPLMAACSLTGHSLVAMLSGLAIGPWERWSFRPRIESAAIAVAWLGVYQFAIAP